MKNSYVLGICGHAGAGKDMVADYLCSKFRFLRIALADPIKDIAHEFFGVPREHLFGATKPEKVRRLLQQLGTDVGRAYDPDIWINFLCDRMAAGTVPLYLVTDIRFPDEAEALVKRFNADLILIRRPNNPNNGKEMMLHVSETAVDKIGYDLFRTTFINLEGRQEEMLKEIALNVEEWVRCHNSRKTPE